MKVRIGDKIYDSNKEPILLVLTDFDIENISEIDGQKRYCSFPEHWDRKEIKKLMDLDKLERLEEQQLIELKTQKAREFIRLDSGFIDFESITSEYLPYMILALFDRLDEQEKRMVIEQITRSG
ncbi:MAG: hypothetical protein PHU23_17185 [Dehalococcoidales bacterium]|nr:hypothetical protein [Dehalococcoidales bacterium]